MLVLEADPNDADERVSDPDRWFENLGSERDWDDLALHCADPRLGYGSTLDVYRELETWRGEPDPSRHGTARPARCTSSRRCRCTPLMGWFTTVSLTFIAFGVPSDATGLDQ